MFVNMVHCWCWLSGDGKELTLADAGGNETRKGGGVEQPPSASPCGQCVWKAGRGVSGVSPSTHSGPVVPVSPSIPHPHHYPARPPPTALSLGP